MVEERKKELYLLLGRACGPREGKYRRRAEAGGQSVLWHVRQSRPAAPCLPSSNLETLRLTPQAGLGMAGQIAEHALSNHG